MSADAGQTGHEWTEAQLDAIRARGSSLLVSAAAGSGKTSVLTERCVSLVCDDPRCNVNQLLVVTFTEAAASEMKGRIEQALRRRLAAAPGDDHLRRQCALLEQADISTLHAFCNRLLKQYFHRLELDPAFRILDGDEAWLVRRQVARDLFSRRYEAASPDFEAFVESFAGTGDDALMELVIDTHEVLCSLTDPQRWIEQSAALLEQGAALPLEDSELGRRYISIVEDSLVAMERDCEVARSAVGGMEGFEKYAAYLDELLDIARGWRRELARCGYDALAAAVKRLAMPRLPNISNATPGKDAAAALIKPVQELFKDGPLVRGLRFSSEEWRDGLRSIVPHGRVFLSLVEEFADLYRREKEDMGALDFSDLERRTLALLREGDQGLGPSPVARVLHRRYQHVLVDEYQDINEVQDAILHLVSRECVADPGASSPNLFCVGDVKQSIYRFRLADPVRFLERAARFRRQGAVGRVIDLQANFRSRAPLLHAVNRVFEKLMSREAAEIDYDRTHWLHPMASYPAGDGALCFTGAPIELHYLPEKLESDGEEPDPESAELERSEREALLIAHRIRQLMGQDGGGRMCVVDRGRVRPLEYRDIVVLLRATSHHADQYARILRQAGVPVYSASGSGYFDAMEVRDMLSLLRLLDNRRQDIPLAAVLRSPLVGLPDPENSLARIRLAADRGQLPFHEAVFRYAAENSDELAARLRDFLADLDHWRRLARHRPVADLIWTIYQETGFPAFCSGLENGTQRCANLMAFYQRARQFDSFSSQGLCRFNRYLESLRDEIDAPAASDLSEAENVVRVLSIHKSKGLEFPVVFLAGLGRRMNQRDLSGSILIDRQAGLGMVAVDLDRKIRYPSLASELVRDRLRRQAIAEEIRILYVAMTRAREHLVLVGTTKPEKVEGWSRAWSGHRGRIPPNTVLSASTALDWIGPVAASGDGAAAFSPTFHDADEIRGWMQSLSRGRASDVPAELVLLRPLDTPPEMDADAARIIGRLRQRYPYEPFTTMSASASVTSLKGHVASPVQSPHDIGTPSLPSPRFLSSGEMAATDRGTATHLFLEYLDYTCPCDAPDLERQKSAMLERRLITPQQAQAVDLDTVLWMLSTDLGRLIRANSAALLRELPLNYALSQDAPGSRSDDPLDRMMLRGRIDLVINLPHGLIVVDYKTDRVFTSEALAQRTELYRTQLDLYCRALAEITGRSVTSACLVFLTARRIVEL